jgi:hypothetical protein
MGLVDLIGSERVFPTVELAVCGMQPVAAAPARVSGPLSSDKVER